MNKEVIYVRIDEDLKQQLDMIALEEQSRKVKKDII